MIYEFTTLSKNTITRIVFGWIFCVLIYQLCNNLMLHQLQDPVLIQTDLDLSYWAVFYSEIPAFINANFIASISFDSVLFLLFIATIIFPEKQLLRISSTILFFLYVVQLNTFMCWHYHNLMPLILILFPLCFKNVLSFSILFKALRYFVLFIYGSAAIWKLVRGSVFNHGQMNWIIDSNFKERISNTNYELNIFEDFILMIGNHPELAQIILVLGILIEFIFLIGFFTTKYDLFLIILAILFHIGTSILVDVSFVQLWILFLTLVPFSKINLPRLGFHQN